MIGMYAEHSSTFLRVFAVLTGVVFSLPIFVAPLTWARIFRWQVDARADLALYFGRCLGAFAVIISSTAWYVAGHPTLQPLVFTMLITFFVLMFFLLHYSITRRCGRLFVFVREPVALVSGKDQLIQYRSARRQYAYYLKGGVFVS